MTQQARHAVQERLTADDTNIPIDVRLPSQMLAGAKTDFQPDLSGLMCEQRRRVEGFAVARRINRQFRQIFF